MSDQAPTNEGLPVRDSTGTLTDQAPTQTAPSSTSTEPTSTTPSTPSPEPSTESADGKTVLTKPSEGKPSGAPENYAQFKAPEGYTLSNSTIEAAAPIFKDLGLSQEQAQKLVDFHSAQMIEAAKGPQTAYETMRTDWQNQTQNDPEIKGKLDVVKTDIGRALNALGDTKLATEFKAAMDLTGAGDHPAFVKTFWKLSQFVTEGSHVAGSGPSTAGQRAPGSANRPTAAQSLYPKLPTAG
jgi:hypothetical protein